MHLIFIPFILMAIGFVGVSVGFDSDYDSNCKSQCVESPMK